MLIPGIADTAPLTLPEVIRFIPSINQLMTALNPNDTDFHIPENAEVMGDNKLAHFSYVNHGATEPLHHSRNATQPAGSSPVSQPG